MAKERVIFDADKHQWSIVKTDKKGTETIIDRVDNIEPMSDGQAVQVFQGMVAKLANKRQAAVSLLVSVLQYKRAEMEKHIRAGDKKTGQLSDAIREEFRDAESAFFGQWLKKNHPGHKGFIKGLPMSNERGDPIVSENRAKDMQPDAIVAERYTYFLTQLRKDPSYSNAKNLVLRSVAFVGMPFTVGEDGAVSIVPPEVQKVMITAALELEEKDNSWETRFSTLMRELCLPIDPTKPIILADARVPGLVQDCKILLGELERLATLAAQRAAKLAKPGDVAPNAQQHEPGMPSVTQQTADVIEKAKELPTEMGTAPI